MARDIRNLNFLFAGVLAVLAGCVVAFLYTNEGRQTVIGPASAQKPPDDQAHLPENHPPIDSARELMVLEDLSRKQPENPEHKTKIGNLYYDMGQYGKAIEAYRASLALRPREPNVETDMATCFHQLGQHDKALEVLENVLSYRPGFTQALLNKGVVLYAGKNDRKGAVAIWEELLRTNPNLPQRAQLEARIQQLKAAQ